MSRSKEDLARRLEELRAENADEARARGRYRAEPGHVGARERRRAGAEAPPAPESGPLEVQPDRDSEMDGQGNG